MRNGLVILTLAATLFTAGCIRYLNNGTYSDFKHPLPAGIESCLGETTLSPGFQETLSDSELYGCAKALYIWAETDCSLGNYFVAEQHCGDALENLDALSDKQKQTPDYETLKERIENLKMGIEQQGYCRE
jgi:hypothetical protein